MSVPHLQNLSKYPSSTATSKRNYGKLLGAYLYLRSIGATRGRSFLWTSLVLAIGPAGIGWLQKHSLNWLR